MFRSTIKRPGTLLPALGVACIMCIYSTTVNAQMSNNPWVFQPQNRASVAALIQQVENKESGASAVSQIASPPSYTNLVCGSDGKASASGNTTCVILNNAVGNIDVGQDAHGNPTATNTQPEAPVEGSTDDILQTLSEKSAD